MSKLTSPSSEHRSYWIDSADLPDYPTLTKGLEVDVVVVGAGIVGVLTAHQLKAEGKKVALIESRRALHGVTGYTTAKITAAHEVIYSKLSEEKAELYARANLAAIDWIEEQAKTYSCDFRREDVYLYSTDEKGDEELRKEDEAAKKAGLPVALLEQAPLSVKHTSALRYTNQAQFHPFKFLAPILAEIQGDGSYVFENTAVQDAKEGEPCEIYTDHGTIKAKYLVVATNSPVYDPTFFYARLKPFHDYAVAALLEEPVPQPMFLGVSEGTYTLRSQPSRDGDLLIVSGATHPVGEGGDTTEHYAAIEQFIRDNFKVKSIPYSWSTQDNATGDSVPYIGKVSPTSKKVFVATGFNGWGMTHGVVAAQLITDLICGRKNEYEELYDPNRANLPKTGMNVLSQGITTVKHFVGDRLKGAPEISPKDLKSGEACIAEVNGQKVAAYKGRDGQLHTLSPICTHLGCEVGWNNADQTWDCPCHGSRFAMDGSVLHGPATKPLEIIETE